MPLIFAPRPLSAPLGCSRVLPLPLAVGGAVWYPGWDESVFRMLNLAGTNPALDLVMSLFTDVALPYILILLALPLWWRGHREQAFDLLVLLAAVIVITEVIKYAVDRARPCDVLPNVHLLTPGACVAEGDPAFPSGHSSRIFAVAAFLAVYYRWPVRVSAFLLAGMAGISRVYLGVHWPSDVIAGAALGAGLAIVFVLATRRWKTYLKIRTWFVDCVSRLFLGRTQRA